MASQKSTPLGEVEGPCKKVKKCAACLQPIADHDLTRAEDDDQPHHRLCGAGKSLLKSLGDLVAVCPAENDILLVVQQIETTQDVAERIADLHCRYRCNDKSAVQTIEGLRAEIDRLKCQNQGHQAASTRDIWWQGGPPRGSGAQAGSMDRGTPEWGTGWISGPDQWSGAQAGLMEMEWGTGWISGPQWKEDEWKEGRGAQAGSMEWGTGWSTKEWKEDEAKDDVNMHGDNGDG